MADLIGLFAPPTPPAVSSSQRKKPPKKATDGEPQEQSQLRPGTDVEASVDAGTKIDESTQNNPDDSPPPSPRPSATYERNAVFEKLFAVPSPSRNLKQERNSHNESTPLIPKCNVPTAPSAPVFTMFDQHSNDKTPKTGSRKLLPSERRERLLSGVHNLPSIRELPIRDGEGQTLTESLPSGTSIVETAKYVANECMAPSTWIGGFMFMLFQLVFSLTMGATITRPHGTTSMLGLMTKMAALGIMLGAPVYWINLPDVPAIYPTVDLFPAPFLANIAVIVDEVLHKDSNVSEEDNDQVFLATFTFLVSASLFMSGTLLVLASVFKLANLGAFLPFPVLCGFFAAVGVMTWTLAFKVDTNGLSVQQVFLSGDTQLILISLVHHAPSVVVAAIMKYLGPKNPFYVVVLVFSTVALFYTTMLVFGMSMDEMVERKWFWSKSDLHYMPMDQPIGFSVWNTPAPFGWINAMFGGKVHWKAAVQGFDTTVALSFLYLIRCSLHGAALKKNVPMLSRVEKMETASVRSLLGPPMPQPSKHRRHFSEAMDIEHVHTEIVAGNVSEGNILVSAKPSDASLKHILIQYGYSQFICSLVGGPGVTPCVATSPTMYMLGAEKLAPQIVSVIVLSVFYLTNFELVSFIPKPAFSSLLVLAFIDMISNWFIKSYFKTKEKMEWLVVPLIVVLAFVVGLLQAVFLGLAMSTFLFVAAFFRSGVVKYAANGINIRSTIERSPKVARWLDENADMIQILLLQNYLFFGNASNMLAYVTSMFEEPDGVDPALLPPCPKVVILDLTLVTGVSTSLRQTMSLCGMKPETSKDRSQRKLRFFPDLDGAIGKAEDMLVNLDGSFEEDSFPVCLHSSGFRQALCQIDEQHQTAFKDSLMGLEEHTQVIDFEPSEVLYEERNLERGLFFIQHGIMKIEKSSGNTISRSGISLNNGGTFSSMNARIGSLSAEIARLKNGGLDSQSAPQFRVARVGPGWIVGSIEVLSGTVNPGKTVAVTKCRAHYLSFKKLEEIERRDPMISLQLYKLLSYLMAKRQQVTIAQLGTLHSIMAAPARKKPTSRSNSAHTLNG